MFLFHSILFLVYEYIAQISLKTPTRLHFKHSSGSRLSPVSSRAIFSGHRAFLDVWCFSVAGPRVQGSVDAQWALGLGGRPAGRRHRLILAGGEWHVRSSPAGHGGSLEGLTAPGGEPLGVGEGQKPVCQTAGSLVPPPPPQSDPCRHLCWLPVSCPLTPAPPRHVHPCG